MKKIIISSVIALLVMGCATPVDMRAKKPSLEIISSLPAKQVALCISDQWENVKIIGISAGYPISMRETLHGFTVQASVHNVFQSWVGLLADITNTPNGSETRYFENRMLGTGSFIIAVKQCQRVIYSSSK